jgi:hypothetical protein
MIASFIKGINNAFETKPGTSCDVVTSNNPTISARTRPKADRHCTFTTRLRKRTRPVERLSRRLDRRDQFDEFLSHLTSPVSKNNDDDKTHHHRDRIKEMQPCKTRASAPRPTHTPSHTYPRPDPQPATPPPTPQTPPPARPPPQSW